MTRPPAPEFSRRVSLSRLGSECFRQEIAATEDERAALARRFGLVALDRLSAVVELTRRGHQSVLLRADFEAEFVQSCVVTLDPVGGRVAQRFALLYGPAEAEASAAINVVDDLAFEPVSGEVIDIGEAVAQEFSLALPAFPRCPDAAVEPPASSGETGPFAGLSRMIERRRP